MSQALELVAGFNSHRNHIINSSASELHAAQQLEGVSFASEAKPKQVRMLRHNFLLPSCLCTSVHTLMDQHNDTQQRHRATPR